MLELIWTCPECGDVVMLWYETRTCRCGRAKGKYLEDGIHAIVNKKAKVIGIANSDLEAALARKDHPALRAWLMRDNEVPHVAWVDEVE